MSNNLIKGGVHMRKLLTVSLLCCLFPLAARALEIPNSAEAVLANIFARTSVRHYQPTPVPPELELILLKAAMAAPTALNRQPWRFVVIRAPEVREKLASKLKSAWMVKDAPLAIAVCGDLSRAVDGEGRDFWIQDASAATENMLLAAHALGLGAVWCGVYPIEQKVRDAREILGLPEQVIPLNLVAIGYPAGEETPKEKWDASKVTVIEAGAPARPYDEKGAEK